jgi:hypothetical protein
MDRFDERKPVHQADHDEHHHHDEHEPPHRDRHQGDEDTEPAREGDVLGLGGASVPKTPGDPHTEYDEHSVAQRRARASRGDEGLGQRDDDLQRSKGATGIDMGSGGSGTDIER